MNMTVKKGDTVKVIAGRDLGKQGIIQRVISETSRVVVEGINIRKRHHKPAQGKTLRGIVEFFAPLSRANVAIICPHCSKTTRVKHTIEADGTKYRSCQHCQGSLDSK